VTVHLANPFSGDANTACGETAILPGQLTTDPEKRTCRPCRAALVRNGVCPACGEKQLLWGTHPHNKSGVVNGRLTVSDVETIFYLACDYCSETVLTRVDPEDVAAALTEMGWVPK
jgi:hypothetical protein